MLISKLFTGIVLPAMFVEPQEWALKAKVFRYGKMIKICQKNAHSFCMPGEMCIK